VSYLVPTEFVTKMIDAGEAKIFMSTRDTVVRAYMAGAILALAEGDELGSNILRVSQRSPANSSVGRSERNCFQTFSPDLASPCGFFVLRLPPMRVRH
jgi:hypothetical protein